MITTAIFEPAWVTRMPMVAVSVGGCHRGDAQHHAAKDAYRVLRQPLLLEVRFDSMVRVVFFDLHATLKSSSREQLQASAQYR